MNSILVVISHTIWIHEDIEKFAFFSKAALSALPVLGFRPDIIHCNDWQTGLIPVYLKERFSQESFIRVSSLL